MQEIIEHEVTVTAVNLNRAEVTIHFISTAACAHCTAKSACGMSGKQEKEWKISTPHAIQYQVGQKAVLRISSQSGLKAVWWAYVLPFLCLVFFLFLFYYWTQSEWIAGLSALAGVGLYFLFLAQISRWIKKNFELSLAPYPER